MLVKRIGGTSDCLQRDEAPDTATAETRVRDQLAELCALLTGLRGEATQIEHWAARFLKASLAKFRHLQAIPSRQVEVARASVELIVQALSGRKWWQDLPEELLPPCRLPEFGFVWGRSALFQPHVPRTQLPPQRVRRPIARLDKTVIDQLAATRRKAITPERANAFVTRLVAEVGGDLTHRN